MDIKGISLFLIPTFLVGAVVVFGGFALGLLTFETPSILHNLLMLVVLNLPALFAFLAGQYSAKGPLLIGVFPVPRVAIVRAALVVGVTFVAANLIATALGFTVLDWRLGTVLNKLQDGSVTLTPQQLAVLPAFIIVASTVFTLIMGATLLAATVLGHVYAWHGFLQDRLQPLGRVKAAIVGGVLWAIWFSPVLYYRVLATGRLEQDGAIAKMYFLPIGGVIVAVSLTLILRAALLRSEGLALPAVILGSFIAHNLTGTTAIWGYMFQIETPPWTGVFGAISATLWLLLAIFPAILAGTASRSTAPAASAEPMEA